MTQRDLTGLRGDERGQTTQDFATGISVFLLTVAFTFAFVPSTVTPFGSPVTDAIPAKSDRVASTIIDSYGDDDRSQTLDVGDVDTDLLPKDGSQLRQEFGLRSTAQVNVTFRYRSNGTIIEADLGTGDKPLTAGDDYPSNRPAASTTRVVRLPGVDGCETGCLLVVRVW